MIPLDPVEPVEDVRLGSRLEVSDTLEDLIALGQVLLAAHLVVGVGLRYELVVERVQLLHEARRVDRLDRCDVTAVARVRSRVGDIAADDDRAVCCAVEVGQTDLPDGVRLRECRSLRSARRCSEDDVQIDRTVVGVVVEPCDDGVDPGE